MASQHTCTDDRHTTYINSKTISWEEIQGMPLIAENPYFASIVVMINSRSRFSFISSDSWINSVWGPRLPLTLFYGDNN